MTSSLPSPLHIKSHIKQSFPELTVTRRTNKLIITPHLTVIPTAINPQNYPATPTNSFRITWDSPNNQSSPTEYQLVATRTSEALPQNPPDVFFSQLDSAIDQTLHEAQADIMDELVPDTVGTRDYLKLLDYFDSTYDVLHTITTGNAPMEVTLQRAMNGALSDNSIPELVREDINTVVQAGWYKQPIICSECETQITFLSKTRTRTTNHLYCPRCKNTQFPPETILKQTKLTNQ